ncbi:serine/threonine protein kinase [Rhizobium sp. NBRC 114257]|uniref:Serine/threonine protein kinase n=1 Tax=Rhizobium dioscoreae TaxID=2653122 RepID=A0ABQ0Z997_9HYPH|nr:MULTISPECIES: protein kinase [Rhizobium]GES52121.1 serine/threonine protein kinase [Rhizobium dioscoreae]GLU83160.1 serine/threonine protein kinase [Rhizobium sp. NBRC 114257]
MSGDTNDEGIKRIAASFAELLHLLTHDGNVERPKEVRDLLVDRLRDALDRRLPSLPRGEAAFIGNTFLVEAIVHRNDRTEISRLRHRDLGTFHAMKTIPSDRANEPTTKALLLREASIGMTLRCNDLATTQCAIRLPDGRPALIMEWIGPSLSQRLAEVSLSEADVRAAVKSMLVGLSAIHHAGYVHGDISPANLLLQDGDLNQLKIADFGTMVECGSRYSDLDIAKAMTPGFTAPEVSGDTAMQISADLYSAGCVINLLLDHCDEAQESIVQIKAAARHLTDPAPSQRPPNAMAALALIESI